MLARRPTRVLLATLAAIMITSSVVTARAPAVAAHPWSGASSWGSNHTIGIGYLANGNIVGTWQRMAHAQNGGWCWSNAGCEYPTDGQFGQKTKNHTILWQTQYKQLVPSLVVDGIVGPQTWDTARFFNLRRAWSDANFDVYRYGPTGDRGFYMDYVKPYAVWRISPWDCDFTLIDHPSVHPTFSMACW